VPAVVRAIRPDRQEQARTVNVRLELLTADPRLRTGELATLNVGRFVAEPGFWVPMSALTESARGLWACYVAEPNRPENRPDVPEATHIVKRRDVELIHVNSDRAFVRGTLATDELLILQGVHRLVPGMPVRVAETSGPAPTTPRSSEEMD